MAIFEGAGQPLYLQLVFVQALPFCSNYRHHLYSGIDIRK